MTIQVWCSIEVFHQSATDTIPAMVSGGRITTDRERANACAAPQGHGLSSNFEIVVRSPMRSGRLSQDLSNLHRQFNWTERLMQERYAPVKYATLSNYIRRVTRHKQHLQVRPYFLQPFGRLLAADSRHYHVCQQQMNLSRISLGNRNRLVAIWRFDDVIARRLQCGPRKGSNGLLIFNQKNRLVASFGYDTDSALFRQRTPIQAGQVYLKRCSDSHFTRHFNPSAALPNNPVDCCQP